MNPIKHALTAAGAIFLLLIIPYCIVLVFCFMAALPIPYGDTFNIGHGCSIAMIATVMLCYAGFKSDTNI
jgi:hypothetical protein